MMMKKVMRTCSFLMILSSLLDLSVAVDVQVEGPQEFDLVNQQSPRASLRQGDRRLFYWGNLLYALHICSDSSGWCPDPHCDGPLKPPGCKKSSGSSGGSSSSSSSSSSSGGSESGGEAEYADAEYAEYDEVEQYSDVTAEANSENDISEGVSQSTTGTRVRSRFNMFWAFMGATAVACLIGVFLVKKNKKSEGDDLDHQLSQSVSKRLEKLLEGKSVSPIQETSGSGTSFVAVGKKSSEAPAAQVSQKQNNYDEPDEEAIEMKLDTSKLNYFQKGSAALAASSAAIAKPFSKKRNKKEADEKAVEMKLDDSKLDYVQI